MEIPIIKTALELNEEIKFNETDVRKFFKFFKHDHKTEIRIFDKIKYPEGKSITVTDEQEFVSLVKKYNVNEKIDVYIGGRDRTAKGDDNITCSDFIFIEIDEHDVKKPELKKKAENFLKEHNIEIGMAGLSGGGFHFYISHKHIDLLDKEDRKNYKVFLNAFKKALQNNEIDIDPKVFNLERVSRVLGTYNFKRNALSKILYINNDIDIEKNTQAINDLAIQYKEVESENIDVGTAIEILKKYKIDESDKWLYDIINKKVIIKPDTGGNSTVYKCGALICCREGLNPNEIKVIGKTLSELVKDRPLAAFYGWMKKVNENGIYEISKNEVNKFIKENNYPLTPYELTTDEKEQNIEYHRRIENERTTSIINNEIDRLTLRTDPNHNKKDVIEVLNKIKDLDAIEKVFYIEKIINKTEYPKQTIKDILKELEVEAKKKKKNKTKNEIPSNYILDDSKITKEKVFAQDKINENIFGIGIFLPRMITYDTNFGQKTKQKWFPVIILSDGDNKLLEIEEEKLEKELKIKFSVIPSKHILPYRLETIKKYLDNEYEIVDLKDLFEKIKGQYKKYLYFLEDEFYDVHSLWDMGTYCFNLFSTFPLMELRADKLKGKTKVMQVSNNISFNALDIMINPSEASLFRETNDSRPTKYIDEAEKLFAFNKATGKYEGDTRAELLNASYKKTGKVPRQEKIGNKFVTQWYSCYSPTMIGSINGLFGATESRAITHIMTKNPKSDPRGNLEPENDSHDFIWQDIRDKLFVGILQHWKEIDESYKEMDKIIRNTNIEARNFEIWRPLLSIAKVIDHELFENMKKFASETSKQRNDDTFQEGTLDYKIIKIVYKILSGYPIEAESTKTYKIYIEEIKKELNQNNTNERFSVANKTISAHLDILGFKRYRKKDTNKGSFFDLNMFIFRKIIEPIWPALFSIEIEDEDKNKDKKEEPDSKLENFADFDSY